MKRRKIFSRFWYIRTDAYVCDQMGCGAVIPPSLHQEAERYYIRKLGHLLFTPGEVRAYKNLFKSWVAKQPYSGKIKTIRVTLYLNFDKG